MANYSTNEFRSGLKIMLDNDPCSIIENEFVKPGKGQAFNRVKIRNLKTGRVLERTFKSGESVEAADVLETEMEYSYTDGTTWTFMDAETYEQVSADETAVGDAMKWLVDEIHPQAEVVRVVLDNLSTHKRAALYETFPPEEANRLCKKLEFHYTPKHGSWLNMAEIELSVFERLCLSKRIPDEPSLELEVKALQEERNAKQAAVNWQFRTDDARIKLKRLYPSYSG